MDWLLEVHLDMEIAILTGYSPQGHKESDMTKATWHPPFRGEQALTVQGQLIYWHFLPSSLSPMTMGVSTLRLQG